MRQITQNSVNAFLTGQNFKEANMKIVAEPNVTIMLLHDNPIAYLYNDPNKTLSITNAGWETNTTKARLNALPNVSIKQKQGKWYLNGEEWDGKLIDVK